MLFGKNDERAGERVLYKTKPNMFLGCKKAIIGVVLLAIVFVVSPKVIKFIGEMQVYLISRIQLPLTRYAAIGFFVVILVIIIYVIWQILKWNSIEYTLTDSKIIIKSGLLSSKRNYMPYATIQDINTSQSIIARLFNVGTVSTFSAYDNNQIKLENISNPSKVEEIIFSNMMGYRNFQKPPSNYMGPGPDVRRQFEPNDDYYDEYEPITPLTRERNTYQRAEYEYYPEDFNFNEDAPNKYEYEPYGDELDYNIGRAVDRSRDDFHYEGAPGTFSNEFEGNYSREGQYNRINEPQNYYNDSREGQYNRGSEPQNYYNDVKENFHKEESKQVENDDTSETVIRRHFDKFKK